MSSEKERKVKSMCISYIPPKLGLLDRPLPTHEPLTRDTIPRLRFPDAFAKFRDHLGLLHLPSPRRLEDDNLRWAVAEMQLERKREREKEEARRRESLDAFLNLNKQAAKDFDVRIAEYLILKKK